VTEYSESVAADYLLICCYRMEYIEGAVTKLSFVVRAERIRSSVA